MLKHWKGYKLHLIGYNYCYLSLKSTVVGPSVCGGVGYGIRPVVAALPSWFRFAQCMRRYRDTRLAFPHLANAGKYATTFFVVIFSTLHSIYKGSTSSATSHCTRFTYMGYNVNVAVVSVALKELVHYRMSQKK